MLNLKIQSPKNLLFIFVVVHMLALASIFYSELHIFFQVLFFSSALLHLILISHKHIFLRSSKSIINVKINGRSIFLYFKDGNIDYGDITSFVKNSLFTILTFNLKNKPFIKKQSIIIYSSSVTKKQYSNLSANLFLIT